MSTERLVWIDLEMTGLDIGRHVIVEVAAIITEPDLTPVGEGIDLVVHATDAQLAEMDDFVTNMHGSSGLTEEIKSSTVSLADAEKAVLELIETHCGKDSHPLLAGNSIGTDRSFIKAQMPKLDEALHYRMIDVSTIKELTRRWYPRVYQNQPKKGLAHRALADIEESIRELAYYREAIFPSGEGPTSEEAKAAAARVSK